MLNGFFQKLKATSYKLKTNNGFTLIEVVTALAIFVIMGSVTFLGLYNYRLRRGLDWDAQKIAAALRETRNRSVSQLDGNQWGVHFENPTGTADFFQVFSSSTYASGTPVGNKVVLNGGIIFLDPASSAFKDIVFSKVSGLPATTTAVRIGTNSGSASTTINIDAQGQISY